VLRPLQLPLLEPHRSALEKCVYCPKLSRAACPISSVEANETVTPWGKMSMAYFAGRGDVPIDAEHAAPAWACSGCFACRERCDHKNEVATVLTDARAELFAKGAAPDAAQQVVRRWPDRARELSRTVAALERAAAPEGAPSAEPAAVVLIGCGYVRRSPEVARDALRAVAALVGGPARPVRSCCGLPLLYAGDRAGFQSAARRLAAEVAGARRLVVVDPGCARALLVEYARDHVELREPDGSAMRAPELFVDVAYAARDRLKPAAAGSQGPDGHRAFRYHDPCQLGRGLGRYDEPRAVLSRALGVAPGELPRTRAQAECSGAGGLLPATRPATSRAIADERIAEHHALGGGTLITGCGQSLHRFRTRGQAAEDLVSIVARALA
jgi:dimethylglycine catabolism B